MAWFRVLATLYVLGIAGCVLAFWRTGERKFLSYAFRATQVALAMALVFFGVLGVQRLG